jgi:hypothetical protein
MITEFVVDKLERSFASSFSTSGVSVGIAVATLPSIDEFVADEPERDQPADAEPTHAPAAAGAAEAPDEFVQRTSRSPWGTYEARHEVSGTPAPPQSPPAVASLAADLLSADSYVPVVGPEAAVVNEVATPADAWEASARTVGTPEPDAEPAREATLAPGGEEAAGPASAPQAAPEVWVAEERDAFDWHGVANLAIPPAEEQRAAEEWSSTEWERSAGSAQEHIAAVLAQLSRRIRSGELEVQGSKQMGTEAALVAALSALLAESNPR